MAVGDIVINEIRIDQPGADTGEFFELGGTPGTLLDGLTYLVIGDGAEDTSGVIEAVVSLDGQAIQDDGLFAAGEDTNPFIATLDLIGPSASPGGLLNFENSDNVTHLVVSNFTGTDEQDLDTDDDGVLDITPWDEIIDSVALIETIGSGNQVYSDAQVGPDGEFVPGIVFRDPDIEGPFVIGAFDFGVDDTPGTLTVPDLGEPVTATIPEIQGAGHVSPFVSETVTTTGVITAITDTGFYLQDPTGDGNDATSDALFVEVDVTGFAIGNEIEVTGVVEEAVTSGLGVTQIAATEIAVLNASVDLPASTVIGEGGRTVPNTFVVSPDEFNFDFSTGIPTSVEFVEAGGTINLNDPAVGNANFDPEQDGIDFYESLEGMLVTLNDTLVVQSSAPSGGPGFPFTDNIAIVVVDNGASSNSLNDRSGLTIGLGATDIFSSDVNPERIPVDLGDALVDLGPDFPSVIPQSSSLGDVTGILSYAGTAFEVLPTQTITPTLSEIEPEVSELRGSDNQLLVAAYNVLNLDPNDGVSPGDADIADGRFDAIAKQIINNLNTPDVIALQEIQDNDGAADEGGQTSVTAADVTLQTLVDAIVANGGPAYTFLDNPFIGDDANGGEPGGNIRTAFLYNPERVTLVEGSLRPLTDVETQTDGIAGNNNFDSSRIPLVADFIFNGETVTIASVHNTAGGIDNFGNIQPVIRSTTTERNNQGAEINAFVDAILAENPDAKVVIAGDWNGYDYEEWDPITEGTADGGEQVLFNLIDQLPQIERYSFQLSNSNLAPLDHIFVTESLLSDAAFDIVHVTADFPDVPSRASDHDPILARITVGPDPDLVPGTSGDDVLDSEGDPAFDGRGDIVFASSGDDLVDSSQAVGGNRIYAGSGDDELFAGTDDRLFGSAGDDTLDASQGNGGNRLYGGAGDDLLLAGAGDRLIGGAGDDFLVIIAGGDNLLTGGAGDDTFQIFSGEQPDVSVGLNTITDFTIGEDLIGVLDNSLGFADITLTGVANDTLIAVAGGPNIALISGVNVAAFTADNFVFGV